VVVLFANIGYFYAGVFVIAALFCISIRTLEGFLIAVFLGWLDIMSWVDSLWSDPGNMAIVHLGILICMTLSLYGNMAKKMVLFTLAMLIMDMLWVVMPELNLPVNELNFPYSYFWWQSSVNIIYFLMCVFTIVAYYRELKQEKQNRSGHDGSLLAFAINKISRKNLV